MLTGTQPKHASGFTNKKRCLKQANKQTCFNCSDNIEEFFWDELSADDDDDDDDDADDGDNDDDDDDDDDDNDDDNYVLQFKLSISFANK